MTQYLSEKNMAFSFSHDKDPLGWIFDKTELILQKDSKDDLEATENHYVTFEEYFGASDELN